MCWHHRCRRFCRRRCHRRLPFQYVVCTMFNTIYSSYTAPAYAFINIQSQNQIKHEHQHTHTHKFFYSPKVFFLLQMQIILNFLIFHAIELCTLKRRRSLNFDCQVLYRYRCRCQTFYLIRWHKQTYKHNKRSVFHRCAGHFFKKNVILSFNVCVCVSAHFRFSVGKIKHHFTFVTAFKLKTRVLTINQTFYCEIIWNSSVSKRKFAWLCKKKSKKNFCKYRIILISN